MADEFNDSKVSLKSSMKTISSGNVYIGTLNVPNFFILPEYNGTSFDMKSPPFECANETWRLNLHQSHYIRTNYKSFNVYLLKMDSNIGQQAMICTIDLLDAYGETYYSCCRTRFEDDDDEEEEDDDEDDDEDDGEDNDDEDEEDDDEDDDDDGFYIGSFNNKKSSYDRRDTLTLIIHLSIGKSFKVAIDQIPLKTDTDVEILSQDFKKLFLNGKNQDLTLRVADKEFRVHQDILMARSQVFAAMLSHDMTEKNKGVIDVPDCNPEAMKQLLLYLYSGKVETLNQDNMFGLYYAADKYQMIPLKEECSKFIKQSISVSVICEVIQLALNHSDTELLECATEYFLNHVNEILPTVEWMSFMKSNTVVANELFIKVSSKCDCGKSKKL